LQEQRIGLVPTDEQHDPGPHAHAPHADRLPSHVDHPELLQKVAAVGLQRAPIGSHELVDPPEHLVTRLAGLHLANGHDDRRIAHDARLAVDHAGELVEGAQAVLAAGLGQHLLGSLGHPAGDLRAGHLQDLVGVQPSVPHRELGKPGERPDLVAIRLDGGEHRSGALPLVEAPLPPGDGDARGQPLHVPFPRPGQRLVEVVDVEHQVPLGRGEHPEVAQVRVTTHLDGDARPRRVGQIRRHDERGAAVERERGRQHPPVADGHQLRHPRRRLLLEEVDRIRPARIRLERRVRRPRDLGPSLLAALGSLGHRQVWHHGRLGGPSGIFLLLDYGHAVTPFAQWDAVC
jgi:hypothetical protein